MKGLLTLEETLYDQNNLEKLCEDRELITEEIFKPNAYYGHNKIVKVYAGIPNDKSLKAVLLHGVVDISKDNIWEEEIKALLPIIFTYSPHSFQKYTKKTNKLVIAQAAPYIYLSSLLKSHPKPERRGTIYFLSHSTHHVSVSLDLENIANSLETLDEKLKPLTICVYWRDFNLGHHEIFLRKGFKVVSAGHMFDPQFLVRLYHLCSMHQYAASNQLGSHLFYAVYSGCNFFFLNYGVTKITASKDRFLREVNVPDSRIINNFRNLFSTPQEQNNSNQLAVVNSFLGVQHFTTPEELKKKLEFADKLDKFGFAKNPQTMQYNYRTPNLVPRQLLRHLKKKTAKLIHNF